MSHRKPTVPDLSFRTIDAGRLQLLNVLGAGAYGTVYRARDCTAPSIPGTFYAVKVQALAERGTFNGTYQTREINFHNAASSHPNVLTMHGVVQDDKYLYMILDYCPGGDLFDLVSRTHSIARNNELIRSLFIQLIDAVHSFHEKNIYHRDLKPENILLNEERNQLFVTDFGLSTRNIRSESFGAGSAYYMSPECVNSARELQSYDPRLSDVWSLGIILVNMITGRTPWPRATMTDTCFRAFLENEEFLRTMLPLSRSANRIIRRILTLNPLERIELPALRRLIEEVDSFYMSPEERAAASHHVRNAWAWYIPQEHIVPVLHVIHLDEDSWLNTESVYDYADRFPGSAIESANCVAFLPAPAIPQNAFQLAGTESMSAYSDEFPSNKAIKSTPTGPLHPTPLVEGLTSFYDSVETLESDESGDSSGPHTPETHAQDVVRVAEPEMSEVADLGEPLEPPVDVLGKQPHSPSGVDMMQRFLNNLLAI